MLTFLLVLTAFFTFIICYYANYIIFCIKRYYYVTKIPGPPLNNRIIGNLGSLYTTQDKMFNILRKWNQHYYPVYNLIVMYAPAANIVNPEDCELIMNNIKHIKKSIIYNILHDWLKLGLLTSKGEKWQTRRKILTPTFHFSILQQFVSIFNEETEQLVMAIEKKCDKPFIPINDDIVQFTLKSIAETAMGTKLQFNTEREQKYKNSILEMGEVGLYRLIRTWLMFKPLYMLTPTYYKERKLLKILHTFTNEVISEREKTFENVPILLTEEGNDDTNGNFRKKRLAMLDLLLEAKSQGKIDHKGICEEVDTFMFEGHDTTAAALSFVFMILACHKEAQDKILEEMQEVLGDIHKKPTLNELQEMKYLERCIKEVLRLYPSVPFISRELGEDIVTNSGYFIPKGTTVHIHIYDIHHNPESYPNPEKFDPDRFLPENEQQRHLFAYVPFSAGPRNCIGKKFAILELKSAVCGVLANFILEPVDTPETIQLVVDLVLRTKDNIRIKFVKRN